MVIFLARDISTSSMLSRVLVADDPDVAVTFYTDADETSAEVLDLAIAIIT